MPVRKILPFLWLFSAVGGEPPKIYRSAQEGGWVEIPCKYDSGYETYPKYFQKGLYGKRETLLDIKGKKFKTCTQNGKYELCDDTNQRILFVTIKDLNLNDAGTYWCYIDAYTFDPKTEIQLEVYKGSKTAGSATSTPSAETHTASPPLVSSPLAGKELYVAAAAFAAVVLLLSLLVVLYRRQKKCRPDRERLVFECNVSSQTNTSSPQHIHLEKQSQQTELDPSFSSPGNVYEEVTRQRCPDDHTSVCHPVSVQTHMVHPKFSETFTSGLQYEPPAPTINQQETPCCRQTKDTEVSAAVAPDYRAASSHRL